MGGPWQVREEHAKPSRNRCRLIGVLCGLENVGQVLPGLKQVFNDDITQKLRDRKAVFGNDRFGWKLRAEYLSGIVPQRVRAIASSDCLNS
jgi:hypothetical protein